MLNKYKSCNPLVNKVYSNLSFLIYMLCNKLLDTRSLHYENLWMIPIFTIDQKLNELVKNGNPHLFFEKEKKERKKDIRKYSLIRKS